MFERTRITIQIMITLVSFFGFNEAVLAARYRNSLYISNFDIRITSTAQDTNKLLAIGYASSGEHTQLTGDPGNLKYNESPIKLVEFALQDMIQSQGEIRENKTVDLAIGIAGFDFFNNDPAPKSEQLTKYRNEANTCLKQVKKKGDYFKCMIRKVYKNHGWTVEKKLVLTGDHNLLVAGTRAWLDKQGLDSNNFDFIQATTVAVPYKIRNGEIEQQSALLPLHLRTKGGYWDLGQQASQQWFSPIPYTNEAINRAMECSPVRQTLYADCFVRDYDEVHGQFALFRKWHQTFKNPLGTRISHILDDNHTSEYLSGPHAVAPSIYTLARRHSELLVNEVIRQMIDIINRKQEDYYRDSEKREFPIVIMGEFAKDVLDKENARQTFLEGLATQERDRIKIIPGDDFFYTLSAAGQQLLKARQVP